MEQAGRTHPPGENPGLTKKNKKNPHFTGGERRFFSVSSRCAMQCFPDIRTSLAMLLETCIILNFADSAQNTGSRRRAKQGRQLGYRKFICTWFCSIERASRSRIHIVNQTSESNITACAPALHFHFRHPCMQRHGSAEYSTQTMFIGDLRTPTDSWHHGAKPWLSNSRICQ